MVFIWAAKIPDPVGQQAGARQNVRDNRTCTPPSKKPRGLDPHLVAAIRYTCSTGEIAKHLKVTLELALQVGQRWGASPFEDGTLNGEIREFGAGAGSAKHQPSPAHIAATHEIAREKETRTKDLEQHFAVFSGGDAAEENGLTL